MFKAIYSINNDKRYTGKFQTIVDTDNVEDVERMINIRHYPFTVTVHSVTKS
jgi:hypothetical protein